MLIVTGVLIALVLVVLVGNTVRTLQGVGWMPITPLDVEFPLWMGTWLGIFPTVETLLAQVLALAFVLGSYFAAEWVSKRRLKRLIAAAEPREAEGGREQPEPDAERGAAADATTGGCRRSWSSGEPRRRSQSSPRTGIRGSVRCCWPRRRSSGRSTGTAPGSTLDQMAARLHGWVEMDGIGTADAIAQLIAERRLRPARRVGPADAMLDQVLRRGEGHPTLIAAACVEAGRRAGLGLGAVGRENEV